MPAAAQPLPGLVLSYEGGVGTSGGGSGGSGGRWVDAAPNVHLGLHGYEDAVRQAAAAAAAGVGKGGEGQDVGWVKLGDRGQRGEGAAGAGVASGRVVCPTV